MRTNIEIDDKVMEQIQQLSELETKKEIVNAALHEYLRRLRMRDMAQMREKGTWEGDLDQMRQA